MALNRVIASFHPQTAAFGLNYIILTAARPTVSAKKIVAQRL